MIIISACFLLSCDKVRLEMKKAASARELCRIVSDMISMVKFQSYDVFQICEICFKDGKACDYNPFLKINGCFRDEWIKACSESLSECDDRVKEQFCEIGDFLGMLDAESQTFRLTAILSEINLRRTEIEFGLDKKRRIYLCMGMFTGIMICLIFT